MIRNEEELRIWEEYLIKRLDSYDSQIFIHIIEYKNSQIIDNMIKGVEFARDLKDAVRKAGL